jgi:hypothetical protein
VIWIALYLMYLKLILRPSNVGVAEKPSRLTRPSQYSGVIDKCGCWPSGFI